MPDVTFHSLEESSYLWTAMHVADEKGVTYELVPFEAGSSEHLKLQPFGKMPVLRHGKVVLYEALAIAYYLNEAFDGPYLLPDTAFEQAEVMRWISIVNSYVFPIMNRFMRERLVKPSWGFDADITFVTGARGPLMLQVRLISDAVSAHRFLVGNRLSLADSFLLPNLLFFSLTPEGKYLLDAAPKVRDWLERMLERPSYAASPMSRSAVHQLPPSTRMTWPVT